ncbi:MAG: DUF1080 domain-containing protein, partial [Candidatus Hydrogenedentes bacterium]|nr:DUF1080 domain-containing protein [Candidatus Hydrogenedentota bacterium]
MRIRRMALERVALLGMLLAVVCGCQTFAGKGVALGTHSAVTPVSRDGDWWMPRHEEKNARIQKGDVDLLFIGDSITHSWENSGAPIWERYYSERNAVNLGFSGDRTQHVLWRLEHGNIDGISPELAVIMIGTNNYNDNSAEEIGEGVLAIVDLLREKLPKTKILLLGIFPRMKEPCDVRDKLAKASAIFSEAAKRRKVHYLDIGDVFLDENGVLPESIMPDALHPNELGYQLWADAIEPMVAKLMPKPQKPKPPRGFRPLFNGKDLSGWKGLVGDPEARAKMSPAELAKAQAEADEAMRQHWRVINGTLVYDGKGTSLCTAKDYGDFEMFVDWKIPPEGDSGIYLRGTPQVQIWDPAKWPVGSGGLYNNQKGPSEPLVCADNPIGQWNTFRIKMVGERVTVHLNDQLVVDDVPLENYWDRSKP